MVRKRRDVLWEGLQSVGWEVQDVSSEGSKVVIRIEGPLPLPDTTDLKAQLDAAGVDTSTVIVNLVPVYTVDLDESP